MPASERIAALRTSMEQREPVSLVTVTQGQQIGKQAIVWLDRPPLGDLGLGELQDKAIADAREALQARHHRLLRYRADQPGKPATIRGGRRTDTASETSLFVEVQRRAPQLLIVGAGHIALPLAQMAAICDFAVTVLDDRPLYASRERFPTAEKVLAGPTAGNRARLAARSG